MNNSKFTYKNIILYLKGLLSNKQRHALEKNAMKDAFEDEAMEGLNSLSSDEFENDLDKLQGKLYNRTQKKRKVIFLKNYRIAASVAILVGLGTTMYFMSPKYASVESPIKIVTSPESNEDVKNLEFDESKLKNLDLFKDSIANDVIVLTEFEKEFEVKSEQQSKKSSASSAKEINLTNIKKSESKTITIEKDNSDTFMVEKKTYQEKQLITGTVTDAEGEPLPGTNVIIAGTNQGTTTDFDGNYAIEITEMDSLTFDFIGFEQAIHPANDSMSIALQENTNSLDEVVVVGYGTQRKTDVAGSNSFVDSISRKTTGLPINENDQSSNYTSSIPPTETLDKFKTWVLDQLNPEVFEKNKKYSIQISFTIDINGNLKKIKMSNFKNRKIKNEIITVLSKSPTWKPADKNDVIVSEKREFILEILFQ